MENIIYKELRYRGYMVDVGMVTKRESVNNKDTNKQLEVDFITNLVKKGIIFNLNIAPYR